MENRDGRHIIEVTETTGGMEVSSIIDLVAIATGEWESSEDPDHQSLQTKARAGREIIIWTKRIDGAVAMGRSDKRSFRALVCDLDSLIIAKDRLLCRRRKKSASAYAGDGFGLATYSTKLSGSS